MTMKMRAPAGCDALAFDDDVYNVNDGVVIIPREAMNIALSHGFTVISEEEKDNDIVEVKLKKTIKTKQ